MKFFNKEDFVDVYDPARGLSENARIALASKVKPKCFEAYE